MNNSLPSEIWVLDNDEVEPEIFDEEREGTACYVRESELAAVRENAPDGWQLVPKELTRKMADALCMTSQVDAYKAMLAVAPKYNAVPDIEVDKS